MSTADLEPGTSLDESIRPIPDGTLLSVPGLSGAGVSCGLKPSGGPDLALIVADGVRTACGVFTQNRLAAAPVLVTSAQLRDRAAARSIVINSGNANAMTGDDGLATAREMARMTSAAVGGPALVLSTGVIGVPLPRRIVLDGIEDAASRLRPDAGVDVAEAILTTDTTRKTAAVTVTLPSSGSNSATMVTVGGTAKGSGMIHPNMATMLAVLGTDAPVRPLILNRMLRRVVDRSFNQISVDGDTSTNDAVLVLAGGADVPDIGSTDDARLRVLEGAMQHVADALADQIIDDGEGASRILDLSVIGARSRDDARRVAEAVVRSPLVKTALAGGDPNWGRILAAAGNAGVPIDLTRVTLSIAGVDVYRRGAPVGDDREAVARAMTERRVTSVLSLGSGDETARRLTTDLTVEYVRINSEYTT